MFLQVYGPLATQLLPVLKRVLQKHSNSAGRGRAKSAILQQRARRDEAERDEGGDGGGEVRPSDRSTYLSTYL